MSNDRGGHGKNTRGQLDMQKPWITMIITTVSGRAARPSLAHTLHAARRHSPSLKAGIYPIMMSLNATFKPPFKSRVKATRVSDFAFRIPPFGSCFSDPLCRTATQTMNFAKPRHRIEVQKGRGGVHSEGAEMCSTLCLNVAFRTVFHPVEV